MVRVFWKDTLVGLCPADASTSIPSARSNAEMTFCQVLTPPTWHMVFPALVWPDSGFQGPRVDIVISPFAGLDSGD